ncbi:HAD family hydrolase [Oceanibaculum indicum]|uniref:Putative hydrolase of the HAD superfamily n=1 Tax=Oceanibaculum indicum TaxID=526216 RepID=A0A420WP00_9PROT|nr:HAD family hydrolase [Oceanibaculum indicum]RKQ72642.1 putative hydrolase of the HAD superfamily [Oceanibaculum indicum]
MILVFDLDDTLYDESRFVESGFRAVARFGKQQFGWDEQDSLAQMLETLVREGRGAVFDRWLAAHGRHGKALVATCVKTYRHHKPTLSLFPEAASLLPSLSAYPLYLVTDGHKIVQANKVEALGIAPLFRKCFITHRYGIRHAKPSPYCFELIRRREKADWRQIVYIADDPSKDFVGLNPLGAQTVRVLTGRHRHVTAKPGFEARHTIPDLSAFPALLAEMERG